MAYQDKKNNVNVQEWNLEPIQLMVLSFGIKNSDDGF